MCHRTGVSRNFTSGRASRSLLSFTIPVAPAPTNNPFPGLEVFGGVVMAASVAAAALLAIRSVAISDLLSYLLTIHLTALYQTDIFSRSTGAAGRPKNGSRLSPVQLAASNDRMEGSLRANRQDADCDDFGR